MTLAVGTRLGPYEITGALGAGGMGEVYRARDTQLKRDVALKTLPADLALDPERLARFDREAQALAALNHPHIAQVHGFAHEGDVRAIVMELVEGPTLAERIARAPLPPDEALPLAIQLADALEYAHEHGIIHRDLKPANIKLTPDGAVKVLDFGLAKVLAGDAPGPDPLGTSPTMMSPVRLHQGISGAHTEVGVILGTAAYMAPEQARGAAVDKRADIWAFGAVLFEMLTGRACFTGDTVTDVLAAVVKTEPDWSALPADTPPRLRGLLRRCLAKDRKQRLHDVGDARIELTEIATIGEQPEGSPAVATTARRARRFALIAMPAVLALAAVAVGFFLLGRGIARQAGTPRFERLTFREGYISNARFTQGGTSVVYSAQWEGREPEIFESPTDGSSTHQWPGLTGFALFSVGSKGDLAVGRRNNAVSIEEYGPLFTASPSGTAPRPRDENIRWAEWMRDGSTLAVVRRLAGKDVLEIPEGKEVTRTGGQFTDLRRSPDGRRWALTEHPLLDDARGTVAMVDDAGRMTRLTKEFMNVSGVAWSQDGSEIWFSAVERGVRQRLYAVTASPEPHVRIVRDLPGSVWLWDVDRTTGRVLLGSRRARAGIRGQLAGDTKERELGWLDYSLGADISADGRTLLLTDEGDSASRSYSIFLRSAGDQLPMPLDDGFACALSPDGQWVLAIRLDGQQRLLRISTTSKEVRELPAGPVATYQRAAFLSGGTRIVFVGAERDHADRTWIQDVSGGPPSPLTDEGTAGVTVSPQDRFIAAVTQDHRLMFVPLDGSKPKEVGTLGPSEAPCQWSKDGNTLYLFRTGPWLELFAFDVRSHKRGPGKKLEVADPAGVNYWKLVMTRDARFYAYSYFRWLDELYVVDGLK